MRASTTNPIPETDSPILLRPEIVGELNLLNYAMRRFSGARYEAGNKYQLRRLRAKWRRKIQVHMNRAARYSGLPTG